MVNMKESSYKSCAELPLFLNSKLVAKVLGGVAHQWVEEHTRGVG